MMTSSSSLTNKEVQRRPATTREKAYPVLDALFFSASAPLSIDQIKRALGLRTRHEAYKLANSYVSEFNSFHQGIRISRPTGGSYVLHLEPPLTEELRGYISPSPLTEKQLTTLAYIYKHQPVKLSRVAASLGQRVYSDLKKLRKLKVVSRRKEGRQSILRVKDEAMPLIRT